MKKLEAVIFYLLIFAIPVQARLILHSWTSALTGPSGLRSFNQWTSAYLYGTDILIMALFVFWLARASNYWSLTSIISKLSSNNWRRPDFWLIIFFVVSALSIFNSRIIGLSFYQLLKLAEFIGFYFYLRAGLGKIFDFKRVLLVIIASGFFQSVIAIAQYIKQGSVGLHLLGESQLSVNATAVAVFVADSEKYLRAYGTTPHPNILAGWLFVAIFTFYFWYIYYGPRSRWPLAIYAILLLGLFFTFSRVIIGLWVLGVVMRILIVFFKKDFKSISAHIKSRIVALTIAGLAVTAVFSFLFWPQVKSRIHISTQEEAVTQRVYYNKIAGSVVTSHPLLGIGTGQFVSNMMAQFKYLPATAYQPVHNIYLLIASETGFLGFAGFLGFVLIVFYHFANRTHFKKLYHFSFFILASSFLLIGFFDHFLWTSQQGGFIFWMALVLIDNR